MAILNAISDWVGSPSRIKMDEDRLGDQTSQKIQDSPKLQACVRILKPFLIVPKIKLWFWVIIA